jgi:uncharacterized membrane protein YkvA (DUF1232 family)
MPTKRKSKGTSSDPKRTKGTGATTKKKPPAKRMTRTLPQKAPRGEKTPVADLAAKTARDYTEVKKALSNLWQDAAKTTYSAFNTIAAKVEKRFEESRKAINEIDVRYALEKSQEKLKQVGKSTGAAAQILVKQVELLYRMLKDVTGGRFKAPWATISAITAALLYFISPIDVLPDFIPGVGLIDDALVISLCISVIRMDLRRYAEENKFDLAEYGLKK